MSKKGRTFETGFLDPALEAVLSRESGLTLEAGLAAGSETAAWDAGLEGGALATDAGLTYEIKHQMSQKCHFRD